MKKRILSAVLACAATMAVTTTALATAPGGSDEASSSTPATSEPSTSAPAKVEKTIEVELTVGEDGKLEGEALTKQILTDSASNDTYEWKEVETVTFTATGVFKLSFYADPAKFDKELFVVGVDSIPDAREDAEEGFATEQTLTAEHVALFDPAKGDDALVIEAKDASTKISAEVKVLVDAPAEEENNNNVNPGTGIALAVAPAGLAVAFVTVAAVMNKKKRG